jgi:hypothetical protein
MPFSSFFATFAQADAEGMAAETHAESSILPLVAQIQSTVSIRGRSLEQGSTGRSAQLLPHQPGEKWPD